MENAGSHDLENVVHANSFDEYSWVLFHPENVSLPAKILRLT
jgi:hypothetical protein